MTFFDEIFDETMFRVNVNMIEGRIQKFADYLDEPEEYNFEYPTIYQAIVANNKATEADPIVEVKSKARKRRPRANKYDTNKAYRRKADICKKYADARRKKAVKDNEMIYISTSFNAPWGAYTKETEIHDTKLWKPFKARDGRETETEPYSVWDSDDICPDGFWDGENFIPDVVNRR